MPFTQQCNGDSTTSQVPNLLAFADLLGKPTIGQVPATTFPTAGLPSPTPVYSGVETPTNINPCVYTQDASGNWHAQAGVDTTTADGGSGNGPADPAGTLTWVKRQFFRDTWNATQGGKNAFLSIQHLAGAQTLQTNQDRAVWVGMSNITATVASFSITSNVVTVNINTLQTGFGTGATGIGFRPPQIVQITGLTNGVYLNAVNFIVQTASTPGGSQALTLSAVGFTHADVALTFDAGRLDQVIYSMENVQAELDVMGAPKFVAAIDGELSTFSSQLADFHTGAINSPNGGVAGFRCSYFREVGAGNWGSIPPAALRITVGNLSAVDGGGTTLQGIVVSCTDNNVALNTTSTGIKINVPTNRYAAGNYGLDIAGFGANVLDFAIRTGTGQVVHSGPVGAVSLFAITQGLLPVSGSLSANGLKSANLTAPTLTGGTLQVQGGVGATSYSYAVVVRDTNGGFAVSNVFTVANGPSSLTGSNFVQFILAVGVFPLGPATLELWRTAGGPSQGKINTFAFSASHYAGNGTLVFNDTGVAGDGGTLPTGNSSGSIVAAGPITSGKYTVATLPTGVEGQRSYATNGRKIGEGSAAGTGVPVYFSNGSWRRSSDDTAVAS